MNRLLAILMVLTLTLSASAKSKIYDIKVKKGYFKTFADLKDQTLPVNVSTPYGTYQVRTTQFYQPGKETVVNANVKGNQLRTEDFMEDMTVKVLNKKSNAIYMDVETPNVKRGKDMLNTMIKLYNMRGQQEKDEQALNTAKFIEDRLGLIYKDLTGSEAEIEAYKQAHNMADVGIQTKASIARQEQADVLRPDDVRIALLSGRFKRSASRKRGSLFRRE